MTTPRPIVIVRPSVGPEVLPVLEKEGYLAFFGRPGAITLLSEPQLDADAGFWERLFFMLHQWRKEKRKGAPNPLKVRGIN